MKKVERQVAAVLAAAVLSVSAAASAAEPTSAPVSGPHVCMLVPCGTPFGIKLFTNGVVVAGTADLETPTGTVNPAAKADVWVGDIIRSVNGKPVTKNEQIAAAIQKSGGKALKLGLLRSGKEQTANILPVQSAGSYRAGLWVRDSAAGVGTLTFYDPQTHAFAGLGHGITDPDTHTIMPFGCGDIVPVTISGVQKGSAGVPGELEGYFTSDVPSGTLYSNSEQGVFGNLKQPPHNTAVPVCPAEEVKAGPVQIVCTIDGNTPHTYQAEIELLNVRGARSKNMVLHITDKTLLARAGGIVQGMSGSPILQQGRLVGAVTHVFVNDPTRGYGILAENMLSAEKKAAA